MGRRYQYIPSNILAEDQRRKTANAWAQQQRAPLAQSWAQNAMSEFNKWFQKIGEQEVQAEQMQQPSGDMFGEVAQNYGMAEWNQQNQEVQDTQAGNELAAQGLGMGFDVVNSSFPAAVEAGRQQIMNESPATSLEDVTPGTMPAPSWDMAQSGQRLAGANMTKMWPEGPARGVAGLIGETLKPEPRTPAEYAEQHPSGPETMGQKWERWQTEEENPLVEALNPIWMPGEYAQAGKLAVKGAKKAIPKLGEAAVGYKNLTQNIPIGLSIEDVSKTPNLGRLGYIEAKKRPDGKYQLFYRGTTNKVDGFEEELYNSAAEARNHYKAMAIKAEQAPTPEPMVDVPPAEAPSGRRPLWEGKTGPSTYEQVVGNEPPIQGPPAPPKRLPGGPQNMTPDEIRNPLALREAALTPEPEKLVGIDTILRTFYDRGWNLERLEKETGMAAHKKFQVVPGMQAAGEDTARKIYDAKVKPLGADVKDLQTYMTIIRDEDILAQNRAAKLAGGLDSWTDVLRAREQLTREVGPEKIAQFDKILNGTKDTPGLYQQLRDATLGLYRRAGMLSDDAYQDIITTHRHYIDYHREDFSLTDQIAQALTRPEANVTGLPINKMDLEGSTRKLDEPLARTFAQVINAPVVVARNEAAKTIIAAQMALEEGLPEAQRITRQLTGSQIAEHSNKTDTISMFVNGKKVVFQTDPVLATIAKNMEADSIGLWGQVASMTSAPLRKGAVTLNAAFAPRNVVRDLISAYYMEGISPFTRKGFQAYADGWTAAITRNTDFSQAAQSGVLMSGMTENLRNMDAMVRARTIGGIQLKGKLDALKAPFKAIEKASEISEQATRIAVFKYLEGQGVENLSAAIRARNVTVDFAKAGNAVKTANKVIPFLNPGIQGASNTLRLMKENPKQAITASLMLNVPTIAIFLNNQRFETAKDIPADVYGPNWPLVIGEGTKVIDPQYPNKVEKFPIYLKIPKGPVGSLLTQPVEAALRIAWGSGDRSVVENILMAAQNIGRSLSPIDPSISGVLPPLASTAVGWASGKDTYTGQNIIPLKEAANPVPEYQYGPGTSRQAIFLGEKFHVSPRLIDWAIKDYTAGLGSQVNWLVDLGLGALGYNPTIPGGAKIQDLTTVENMARTPILSGFMGTRNTEQQNAGWDAFNSAYEKSQREFFQISEIKDLGYVPSPIGEKVKMGTATIMLKPQERATLQEKLGKEQVSIAQKLSANPKYAKLAPDKKLQVTKEYIAKARSNVLNTYFKSLPREELKRRAIESAPVAVGR